MELLVAIGIMAAIAAVSVPLVTKLATSGESGAQTKELANVQTPIKSLMADAAVVTVDANTTTAVNTWTGLPKKGSAPITVSGVPTDLSAYMRMTNDKTKYFYCWNSAAQLSVHATADACP